MQLARVPGRSEIAKDIRYGLGHWEGLIRFLLIEICTSVRENRLSDPSRVTLADYHLETPCG
jgi:hypothetical protein